MHFNFPIFNHFLIGGYMSGVFDTGVIVRGICPVVYGTGGICPGGVCPHSVTNTEPCETSYFPTSGSYLNYLSMIA